MPEKVVRDTLERVWPTVGPAPQIRNRRRSAPSRVRRIGSRYDTVAAVASAWHDEPLSRFLRVLDVAPHKVGAFEVTHFVFRDPQRGVAEHG